MRSAAPGMIIGACEWVALPELGISGLRARVDTGAKSCALHAGDLELIEVDGVQRIRFRVATGHREAIRWTRCESDLVSIRKVRNTSGVIEERFTIRTPLIIGCTRWDVDITLTNREKMRYRMLLGRSAMKNRVLVDPARTFLQGRPRLTP